MDEQEEREKVTINGKTKNFLKNYIKKGATIALIAIMIIVLLAGAIYYITIDDGTYKEDDWENTNYAASQYINNVSVEEDGTLKSNITAQELWDKMIENDSRVVQYLDSPEELEKLMNVEMIMQYPYTGNDKDDALQGIIKLKRADSNNKTTIMKYATTEEFQGWIDEYNSSGSEEAKKNALNHFTLKKVSSSNGIGAIAAGEGVMADISQKIIDAIPLTEWPGENLCLAWVANVYDTAGITHERKASAYESYLVNGISTDRNAIPIGAAVYGTGTGTAGGKYGHVGIYIGDGKVVDSVGSGIQITTLDEWIGWQEDYARNSNNVLIDINGDEQHGWLGWGWLDGDQIRGTTEDTSITQNEANKDNKNKSNTTSTDTSTYVAVVATYSETETKIKTDDPNVQETYGIGNSETTVEHIYNMTTTTVNYQKMVEPYTVPFDLLWAFMVIGEDKNFVFDFADLVYNSDIQITIYDNLTTNTDVDEWNYTEVTKTDVNVKITSNYIVTNGIESTGNTKTISKTSKCTDDPYGDSQEYTTKKTIITKTNTINTVLTRANVWVVDYNNEYTYSEPQEIGGNEDTVIQSDQDYEDVPYLTKKGESNFSCEHIEKLENEMKEEARGVDVRNIAWCTSTTKHFYYVKYYKKYVDISDKIINTITSNRYTQGVAEVNEKTDKDAEEPNFVTIYLDSKNEKNRKNVKSVAQWLFGIIENNESTADMLDLIKYLLYKATGRDYGVTEFDFSAFDARYFNTIGGAEGGLSLTTTMFTKDVFKQALQAYYDKTGNQNFYNNFLSKADELYDASVSNNINPELVIITAKGEGNFSEAGGRYNYWGIGVPNGASSGYSFNSLSEGIAGYAKVIGKYMSGDYAAMITERYEERKAAGCDPLGYGLPGTLSGMQSIYSYLGKHEYGSSGSGGYYYMDPARAGVTKIYSTHAEFLAKCKDSGLPEHASETETTVWEQGQYTAWQVESKLKFWDEIFGAYGSRADSGGNQSIVTIAKSKIGCPYVYGASGPNSFDCSGFVYWCYKQNGITVPRTTEGYKTYIGSNKEISWNEAQPGDILIITSSERGTSDGHAGIYLGNDSYIHAPSTGQTVTIVESGASTKFKHVFRFN